MKRIVLDKTQEGVRAALMADDELIELIVQKNGGESHIGDIYMGIVENVSKSGFAFVNIGSETGENAFLNLGDNRERGRNDGGLKPGSQALVQILKDGRGKKGPYATRRLSHVGHLLIMEEATGAANGKVTVSKKITRKLERKRLRAFGEGLLQSRGVKAYNVIMRTEAFLRPEEILEKEFDAVLSRIREINRTAAEWPDASPGLVYRQFTSQAVKIASELVTGDTEEIIVNDFAEYCALSDYFGQNPCYGGLNIISYIDVDGKTPIFDRYGVEPQLERAFEKKMWLNCGGYIVIESTEACTVIDVNSGKFTKKKIEEIAYRVNIEAADEIARQLRLRNLSGIIIVDFIGMTEQAHISAVTKRLEASLKKDRVPAIAVGMTRLGLMEITRKKMRNPLKDV